MNQTLTSDSRRKRQRPRCGGYLTPRKMRVMEVLDRYSLIREGTLHRLCFSTIKEQRNAQYKLKGMVEQGYICRRFMPIVRGGCEFIDYAHQERRDAVYFLGPEGAAFLGKEYDPELARVKLSYLFHRLDISDIRATLDLSLVDHQDIGLVIWVDEHDKSEEGDFLLHSRVRVKDHDTGRTRPLSVRPDACFVIEERTTGRQSLFFLEVDEGTESGAKRWKEKVLAYRGYYEQGFKEAFEFRGEGFRVLTVTRSERGKQQAKRKANLVSVTHQAGGRRQFWFATFDQVMPEGKVTGAHFLHSPIWKRVDGELKEPEINLIEHLFG